MEDPPVNLHVFAVLFAIAIIHPIFTLTRIFAQVLAQRVNPPGGFPVNYIGLDFVVLTYLVLVAILGGLIYAALYLGKKVGLGAPLLEGWTKGEPVRDRALSALKIALAVGLGVAMAKYLLDLLVFSPFVPATLSQWGQAPLPFLLPIPFQQGIGDEIVSRLFWMTVIVWIIWKIRGSGNEPLGGPTYWACILMAGLISIPGLMLSGTPGLVILQYAVLILAGAIPFGWLYWKKGIESALVAHFTSSVILVLLSLF
ncbi:MAG TPA: hypothetical protein VKO45_03785 [Methanomicrobiales archaeon]|nr:hypothetical protein [Methanomicrobiales archaeon]